MRQPPSACSVGVTQPSISRDRDAMPAVHRLGTCLAAFAFLAVGGAALGAPPVPDDPWAVVIDLATPAAEPAAHVTSSA